MKKLPHLLLITFIFICFTAQSQKNIWDENPSDSQVELDSLLTILPKSTGEKKLFLLNRIAEIYWVIDPNKTMKYGSEALRLSIELKNKDQEGLALINLCQGYLFNNIYDKALRYGLKSLEIRRVMGNDYDLAFTLRTLGWLYYDIGYFEKALDYHTQTLIIHEKIGDKQRIAYSYNSIGIIHDGKGDNTLALFFFKKSLKLIKDSNNMDRIAETMKNMGVSYRKINELNLSKKFLEDALDIESKIKYDYKKVYILHELAIVHLQLKNYHECYSLLQEARTITKALGNKKELVLENDKIMSDYYLALNNYKEAFEFYMKYTNGNAELFTSNESEKLAEMRILSEAERRESEIKILEQQRKLESQKRKSLLIGSLLLAIIGILIIASLWNNIKKRKAIELQNQKLSKEKLKSQFLLQENLERKLDFRTKELTNLALFISQRTNIYKDLTKSLKNLKFTDLSLLKQDIKALINEYTFKFDLNEDIQQFHANIETLQSDFLFRIKEKHPNLTDKDIQLAVQVKLKLSSKEIANINNISANSVEIGRHRLRKKLGLENKDNLVVYLENI